MKKLLKPATALAVLACLLLTFTCGCTGNASENTQNTVGTAESDTITITDSLGREVSVPKNPDRIVCSGPGCLRYLTYLQAQDKIVGVDDIEIKETMFDARPYSLANPQFKEYPLIGEFRGNDDPEKIVAADPQVIFKTFVTSASDADELSSKTGIPVVALNYGTLGVYRDDMDKTLRIMGEVTGQRERAEDLITFFDETTDDLNKRTENIPDEDKKTAYVGGIAYRGPHGFQSTEPAYPPFLFINALNVAGEMGTEHADVAKEKIVEWDPEIIFVDLSTLQTDPNAITELKDDPSYQQLSAVKSGEVYGVLPYNWYSINHGSEIADAYYTGKILYPETFSDIDPEAKADEIYTYLIGEPVFDEMDGEFDNKVFKKLDIE
ncbi:iron ABC transporter substrate-binding protein [Methanoplanus endosymbiosus]|uniref:Iron ABC transporter substrate-binding protein n=1 Tax=Methanoplanus endosymbiosus TaxID=33865 RepID=A0A9E7TKL0_9EURY|nr:iron ABC transporter substrate-binding protein [Methanoplanus endosymbiosus]UUX91321.1 iron ABC transporter substrate-binding protein [Methanoplanus endosymbiosus]